MKCFLVTIIVVFACLSVSAQNCTHELFLFDPCSSQTIKTEEYFLFNDSLAHVDIGKKEGQYVLNLPGRYKLESQYLSGYKTYIVVNRGYNSDTLRKAKVLYVLKHSPKEWTGYLCCGKKCNGYQIDYYSNGNKRIEGSFKNGKPKKKVTFYKENGELQLIIYYKRRGKEKKRQYY